MPDSGLHLPRTGLLMLAFRADDTRPELNARDRSQALIGFARDGTIEDADAN